MAHLHQPYTSYNPYLPVFCVQCITPPLVNAFSWGSCPCRDVSALAVVSSVFTEKPRVMRSFKCVVVLRMPRLLFNYADISLSIPPRETSKTFGSPWTNSFLCPAILPGLRIFYSKWPFICPTPNCSLQPPTYFPSLKIPHRLNLDYTRSNYCGPPLSWTQSFPRYCQTNNTIRILLILRHPSPNLPFGVGLPGQVSL